MDHRVPIRAPRAQSAPSRQLAATGPLLLRPRTLCDRSVLRGKGVVRHRHLDVGSLRRCLRVLQDDDEVAALRWKRLLRGVGFCSRWTQWLDTLVACAYHATETFAL